MIYFGHLNTQNSGRSLDAKVRIILMAFLCGRQVGLMLSEHIEGESLESLFVTYVHVAL